MFPVLPGARLREILLVVIWFIFFDPSRPYDGKWSKTMVGFGAEDDHFVAELTYNYGIGHYKLGNDFMVNILFQLLFVGGRWLVLILNQGGGEVCASEKVMA